MKITKENKIYYFIKDDSKSDFTSYGLESYIAIPKNDNTVDYKRIEEIRLFFHKDMENYECGSFKIDFGRNDCIFSGCKSYNELIKYMLSDSKFYNFKSVTKDEYLEFRDKAFKTFLDHKQADYSKLEIGCEFHR